MAPMSGSDVTSIIGAQHTQAKDMLAKVASSTGEDRRAAFHALRLTLAAHETAEEQVIHPEAVRRGNNHSAGADRISEEHAAAAAISELERLDIDSDEFNSGFADLADDVIAHAEAEEKDEWPVITLIDEPGIVDEMIRVMNAVPELAGNESAPSADATFTQMLDWAAVRLAPARSA